MALKADRVIIEEDIAWTCESVAERGVVVVKKTSGSGVMIGDSAGQGDVVANPSGYKVLGILMNDQVSVDETRYHRNFHKNEALIGERCTLLKKGWVVTNKITGTPDYGDTAYLDSSGTLINAAHATGGLTARPKVGMFRGKKDADGYVSVEVNLPIV